MLDDEQLIGIYGPRYASKPAEFKFEPGDRKMIHELVFRVKEVVYGNGKLTGLSHFEMTKKIKRKKFTIPMKKSRPANCKAAPKTDISIEDLRSDLFRRTKQCLDLREINTDELSHEIVDVQPNRIFGQIHCILCPRETKKSHSRSQSVFIITGALAPDIGY